MGVKNVMTDEFTGFIEQHQEKEKTQKNINELKSSIISKIDKLSNLYPDRSKPPAIKAVLSSANRLYNKSKASLDELNQVLNDLDGRISLKLKANEDNKKQALKLVEDKAKQEELALKKAKLGELDSNELKKLANQPPAPDTHKNLFRPDWATYDLSSGKWKLDSNLLARTIINDNLIKRVQENGRQDGYLIYDDQRGSWRKSSSADIGYLINSYFEYPEDPKFKSKGQYAFDLQTGPSQRNMIILVLNKLASLNPTQTTDKQPPYIIHFKDYDFDLEHWKRLPFSPERYFLSDRDYNLDGAYSQLPWDALKGQKDAIDELAPKTTEWLLKSLGDKETLQTFLECLGLSFLNAQPVNFFVFFKSTGGTGKSRLFEYLGSLFGKENDTIALDFDQIIKPASFDISEFRNKSIDLTSDVKATYIPNSAVSILKTLSSDDKRSLSQKNKNTANFANHANLWFNCNALPRLSPESYDNSIARRTFIFDWLFIKGFNWDKEKGALQSERSKLVTKALYYAKHALEDPLKEYDYLETPSNITRSHRVINNYNKWKNEHNLLERFINERCKLGSYYRIGVTAFREEYIKYLVDNGHKDNIAIETIETQLKDQYGILKSNKPTSWKKGAKTKRGAYIFQGITFNSFEYSDVQDENKTFEDDRKRRREKSPYIPHPFIANDDNDD